MYTWAVCVFVCPCLFSVWQVAEGGHSGDRKKKIEVALVLCCAVYPGSESRALHIESKSPTMELYSIAVQELFLNEFKF